MLELGLPWALVALPLPLLVLWLAPPRRQVVQAVRVPFFEATSAGLDKGEGAVVLPRSRWQMGFAWLLWALVVLTLARPAWVGAPVERTEAARDVMLAVDISGSMETRDFVGADGARGSRLDGVKAVLDGFIADRRDDRIGMIVFGNAPYVLVPFTRDTRAARSLLDTLAPGMAGKNTMLGDAIGLAIRSFEASSVEARILILLSDGTDTGSRMAPAKAADIAAKNGVVIHTIAVGDPEASADAETGGHRGFTGDRGGDRRQLQPGGGRHRPRGDLRGDRRGRREAGADHLMAAANAADGAAGGDVRGAGDRGVWRVAPLGLGATATCAGGGGVSALAAFAFLRPLVLLALLPLAGLWLLLRRQDAAEAPAVVHIAPHLLAALTIGRNAGGRVRAAGPADRRGDADDAGRRRAGVATGAFAVRRRDGAARHRARPQPEHDRDGRGAVAAGARQAEDPRPDRAARRRAGRRWSPMPAARTW